jgi:hypothetical protein
VSKLSNKLSSQAELQSLCTYVRTDELTKNPLNLGRYLTFAIARETSTHA